MYPLLNAISVKNDFGSLVSNSEYPHVLISLFVSFLLGLSGWTSVKQDQKSLIPLSLNILAQFSLILGFNLGSNLTLSLKLIINTLSPYINPLKRKSLARVALKVPRPPSIIIML